MEEQKEAVLLKRFKKKNSIKITKYWFSELQKL